MIYPVFRLSKIKPLRKTERLLPTAAWEYFGYIVPLRENRERNLRLSDYDRSFPSTEVRLRDDLFSTPPSSRAARARLLRPHHGAPRSAGP